MTAQDSSTILAAACPAATLAGEIVTLPVGSEILASRQLLEIAQARAAARLQAPAMRFMVRCPGAQNPAPYHIDVDTLMIVGLGQA